MRPPQSTEGDFQELPIQPLQPIPQRPRQKRRQYYQSKYLNRSSLGQTQNQGQDDDSNNNDFKSNRKDLYEDNIQGKGENTSDSNKQRLKPKEQYSSHPTDSLSSSGILDVESCSGRQDQTGTSSISLLLSPGQRCAETGHSLTPKNSNNNNNNSNETRNNRAYKKLTTAGKPEAPFYGNAENDETLAKVERGSNGEDCEYNSNFCCPTTSPATTLLLSVHPKHTLSLKQQQPSDSGRLRNLSAVDNVTTSSFVSLDTIAMMKPQSATGSTRNVDNYNRTSRYTQAPFSARHHLGENSGVVTFNETKPKMTPPRSSSKPQTSSSSLSQSFISPSSSSFVNPTSDNNSNNNHHNKSKRAIPTTTPRRKDIISRILEKNAVARATTSTFTHHQNYQNHLQPVQEQQQQQQRHYRNKEFRNETDVSYNNDVHGNQFYKATDSDHSISQAVAVKRRLPFTDPYNNDEYTPVSPTRATSTKTTTRTAIEGEIGANVRENGFSITTKANTITEKNRMDSSNVNDRKNELRQHSQHQQQHRQQLQQQQQQQQQLRDRNITLTNKTDTHTERKLLGQSSSMQKKRLRSQFVNINRSNNHDSNIRSGIITGISEGTSTRSSSLYSPTKRLQHLQQQQVVQGRTISAAAINAATAAANVTRNDQNRNRYETFATTSSNVKYHPVSPFSSRITDMAKSRYHQQQYQQEHDQSHSDMRHQQQHYDDDFFINETNADFYSYGDLNRIKNTLEQNPSHNITHVDNNNVDGRRKKRIVDKFEPKNYDEMELSLTSCRRVSVVVVVVNSPTPLITNKSHISDDSINNSQLCVFPNYLSSDDSVSTYKNNRDLLQAHQKLQYQHQMNSVVSRRDLIVVNPSAFGTVIPTHVTIETAKLVAQIANIQSEDWARTFRFHQVIWPKQQPPKQQIEPITMIPSMPTKASSSLTGPHISHVNYQNVNTTNLTYANNVDGTATTRTTAAFGHSSTCLHNIVHAIVNDVIADHAKIRMLSSTSPFSDTMRQSSSIHLSNRVVIGTGEMKSRMDILFGNVSKESVASVLSRHPSECTSMDELMNRYGLLGMTLHHILEQLPTVTAKTKPADGYNDTDEDNDAVTASCTLSVLEIASVTDGNQSKQHHDVMNGSGGEELYDLLSTKLSSSSSLNASEMFNNNNSNKLRIRYSASGAHDPFGNMTGAVVTGLSETPMDSLKTLGHCIRRAFAASATLHRQKQKQQQQQQQQQKLSTTISTTGSGLSPAVPQTISSSNYSSSRGHIVVTLKITWHTRKKVGLNNGTKDGDGGRNINTDDVNPNQFSTVCQFVDLAPIKHRDDSCYFNAESYQHNANVRKTMLTLGGVLRGILLSSSSSTKQQQKSQQQSDRSNKNFNTNNSNTATISTVNVLPNSKTSTASTTNSMIAYRESTLTKVLQRSIMNDSDRVIVLATISPLSIDYDETIATLRYVNRILYKSNQLLPQSPFVDETPSPNTSPTSIGSMSTVLEDWGSSIMTNNNSNTSYNHNFNNDSCSVLSTSMDQYVMDNNDDEHNELFLRSLVGDPRQRLARLLKTKKVSNNIQHQEQGARHQRFDNFNDNEDNDKYMKDYIPTVYDLEDLPPVTTNTTTTTALMANTSTGISNINYTFESNIPTVRHQNRFKHHDESKQQTQQTNRLNTTNSVTNEQSFKPQWSFDEKERVQRKPRVKSGTYDIKWKGDNDNKYWIRSQQDMNISDKKNKTNYDDDYGYNYDDDYNDENKTSENDAPCMNQNLRNKSTLMLSNEGGGQVRFSDVISPQASCQVADVDHFDDKEKGRDTTHCRDGGRRDHTYDHHADQIDHDYAVIDRSIDSSNAQTVQPNTAMIDSSFLIDVMERGEQIQQLSISSPLETDAGVGDDDNNYFYESELLSSAFLSLSQPPCTMTKKDDRDRTHQTKNLLLQPHSPHSQTLNQHPEEHYQHQPKQSFSSHYDHNDNHRKQETKQNKDAPQLQKNNSISFQLEKLWQPDRSQGRKSIDAAGAHYDNPRSFNYQRDPPPSSKMDEECNLSSLQPNDSEALSTSTGRNSSSSSCTTHNNSAQSLDSNPSRTTTSSKNSNNSSSTTTTTNPNSIPISQLELKIKDDDSNRATLFTAGLTSPQPMTWDSCDDGQSNSSDRITTTNAFTSTIINKKDDDSNHDNNDVHCRRLSTSLRTEKYDRITTTAADVLTRNNVGILGNNNCSTPMTISTVSTKTILDSKMSINPSTNEIEKMVSQNKKSEDYGMSESHVDSVANIDNNDNNDQVENRNIITGNVRNGTLENEDHVTLHSPKIDSSNQSTVSFDSHDATNTRTTSDLKQNNKTSCQVSNSQHSDENAETNKFIHYIDNVRGSDISDESDSNEFFEAWRLTGSNNKKGDDLFSSSHKEIEPSRSELSSERVETHKISKLPSTDAHKIDKNKYEGFHCMENGSGESCKRHDKISDGPISNLRDWSNHDQANATSCMNAETVTKSTRINDQLENQKKIDELRSKTQYSDVRSDQMEKKRCSVLTVGNDSNLGEKDCTVIDNFSSMKKDDEDINFTSNSSSEGETNISNFSSENDDGANDEEIRHPLTEARSLTETSCLFVTEGGGLKSEENNHEHGDVSIPPVISICNIRPTKESDNVSLLESNKIDHRVSEILSSVESDNHVNMKNYYIDTGGSESSSDRNDLKLVSIVPIQSRSHSFEDDLFPIHHQNLSKGFPCNPTEMLMMFDLDPSISVDGRTSLPSLGSYSSAVVDIKVPSSDTGDIDMKTSSDDTLMIWLDKSYSEVEATRNKNVTWFERNDVKRRTMSHGFFESLSDDTSTNFFHGSSCTELSEGIGQDDQVKNLSYSNGASIDASGHDTDKIPRKKLDKIDTNSEIVDFVVALPTDALKSSIRLPGNTLSRAVVTNELGEMIRPRHGRVSSVDDAYKTSGPAVAATTAQLALTFLDTFTTMLWNDNIDINAWTTKPSTVAVGMIPIQQKFPGGDDNQLIISANTHDMKRSKKESLLFVSNELPNSASNHDNDSDFVTDLHSTQTLFNKPFDEPISLEMHQSQDHRLKSQTVLNEHRISLSNDSVYIKNQILVKDCDVAPFSSQREPGNCCAAICCDTDTVAKGVEKFVSIPQKSATIVQLKPTDKYTDKSPKTYAYRDSDRHHSNRHVDSTTSDEDERTIELPSPDLTSDTRTTVAANNNGKSMIRPEGSFLMSSFSDEVLDNTILCNDSVYGDEESSNSDQQTPSKLLASRQRPEPPAEEHFTHYVNDEFVTSSRERPETSTEPSTSSDVTKRSVMEKNNILYKRKNYSKDDVHATIDSIESDSREWLGKSSNTFNTSSCTEQETLSTQKAFDFSLVPTISDNPMDATRPGKIVGLDPPDQQDERNFHSSNDSSKLTKAPSFDIFHDESSCATESGVVCNRHDRSTTEDRFSVTVDGCTSWSLPVPYFTGYDVESERNQQKRTPISVLSSKMETNDNTNMNVVKHTDIETLSQCGLHQSAPDGITVSSFHAAGKQTSSRNSPDPSSKLGLPDSKKEMITTTDNSAVLHEKSETSSTGSSCITFEHTSAKNADFGDSMIIYSASKLFSPDIWLECPISSDDSSTERVRYSSFLSTSSDDNDILSSAQRKLSFTPSPMQKKTQYTRTPTDDLLIEESKAKHWTKNYLTSSDRQYCSTTTVDTADSDAKARLVASDLTKCAQAEPYDAQQRCDITAFVDEKYDLVTLNTKGHENMGLRISTPISTRSASEEHLDGGVAKDNLDYLLGERTKLRKNTTSVSLCTSAGNECPLIGIGFERTDVEEFLLPGVLNLGLSARPSDELIAHNLGHFEGQSTNNSEIEATLSHNNNNGVDEREYSECSKGLPCDTNRKNADGQYSTVSRSHELVEMLRNDYKGSEVTIKAAFPNSEATFSDSNVVDLSLREPYGIEKSPIEFSPINVCDDNALKSLPEDNNNHDRAAQYDVLSDEVITSQRLERVPDVSPATTYDLPPDDVVVSPGHRRNQTTPTNIMHSNNLLDLSPNSSKQSGKSNNVQSTVKLPHGTVKYVAEQDGPPFSFTGYTEGLSDSTWTLQHSDHSPRTVRSKQTVSKDESTNLNVYALSWSPVNRNVIGTMQEVRNGQTNEQLPSHNSLISSSKKDIITALGRSRNSFEDDINFFNNVQTATILVEEELQEGNSPHTEHESKVHLSRQGCFSVQGTEDKITVKNVTTSSNQSPFQGNPSHSSSKVQMSSINGREGLDCVNKPDSTDQPSYLSDTSADTDLAADDAEDSFWTEQSCSSARKNNMSLNSVCKPRISQVSYVTDEIYGNDISLIPTEEEKELVEFVVNATPILSESSNTEQSFYDKINGLHTCTVRTNEDTVTEKNGNKKRFDGEFDDNKSRGSHGTLNEEEGSVKRCESPLLFSNHLYSPQHKFQHKVDVKSVPDIPLRRSLTCSSPGVQTSPLANNKSPLHASRAMSSCSVDDVLQGSVDNMNQSRNGKDWRSSVSDPYQQSQEETLSEIIAARDRAERERELMKCEMDRRMNEHLIEMKRLRGELSLSQQTVESMKADRKELMKIAEEAIATQSELESKLISVERDLVLKTASSVAIDDFDRVSCANLVLEKTNAELSQKVAKNEGELDATNMIALELQQSIGCYEQEKNNLMEEQRNLMNENSRLLRELKVTQAITDNTYELQEEIDRLNLEVARVRSDGREKEVALEHIIREKDAIIEELRKTIDGLKLQLKSAQDDIQQLQKERVREVGDIKLKVCRLEKELKGCEEIAEKSRCELQGITERHDCVLSDLNAVRNELKQCVLEKEALSKEVKIVCADRDRSNSKVVRMENALVAFRRETKSRVEKVVQHRNEAAALLEKTLNENKSLTESKSELVRCLSALQAEHQALKDEVNRNRDRNEVAYQHWSPHETRLEEKGWESSQVTHRQSMTTGEVHPATNRSNLSRNVNNEVKNNVYGPSGNNMLLPTVEELQQGNLQHKHIPRSQSRENWCGPGLGSSGAFVESRGMNDRAEEIAAYMALTAKSTREQHHADKFILKQRMYALEDAKEAEIDLLKSRIRSLERRITEATNAVVVRGKVHGERDVRGTRSWL